MVRAFIMVEAAPGDADSLFATIRGMDSVTETHVIAGDFDLVVEAETGEVYDVIHSVATEIRGLADVTDTKTYVCLE